MLGILGPCSDSRCMLEHDHPRSTAAATGASASSAVTNLDPAFAAFQAQYSTLYHTGSAARWRRKQDDYFAHSKTNLSAIRQRSMEEVHGVDVSWLHKPGRQEHHRKAASTSNVPRIDRKPVATTTPAQRQIDETIAPIDQRPSPQPPLNDESGRKGVQANVSSVRDHASAAQPPPASNGTPPDKAHSKRPGLLGRSSSTRETGGRRTSWLNNISSKFSSSQQTTPERPGSAPAQSSVKPATANGTTTPPATNGVAAQLATHQEEAEEHEPYTPSKPKESSFFSSLTRRLSSASTSSVSRAPTGSGGMCPRRVLNVDPNRQRVLVPEMDANRLRKVSFCVDVEIAGRPQYYNDEEDQDTKDAKGKDAKVKERAEGEALKKPKAAEQEKDEEGDVKLDAQSARALDIGKKSPAPKQSMEDDAEEGVGPTVGSFEDGPEGMTRKKEKKLRSEAERKERKEKRRRKAEESGAIPVELQFGDEDAPTVRPPASRQISGQSLSTGNSNAMDTPPPIGAISETASQLTAGPSAAAAPAARQDRPTTDPVRIYRRCCQLRETPILKRITEQLMAPTCCLPTAPGVVNCLDLTGSRLQLADVVTLGDWLAVVPVKILKLEDADLNDEGIRCILAGLLAAKKPEPTRRKNVQPRHREQIQTKRYQERAGVVEKLNLKHNPRMTRLGWKHVSLFIYMCRSLKAIDLSMNQFPDTMPASAHSTPIKRPQSAHTGDGKDIDAAESFYNCLSERLGGSRLEELQMSECGLHAEQVRKIIDGAIVCGISRLGLAGNHLDDAALEHVIHYLRSGVCQGLDLGGNDLRGKLEKIAEAIYHKRDMPLWGLSLADCHLTTPDLKALFVALVKLPDFRFIDLSHNRDLCLRDNGTISLFRRYMSQFKELKRIHLADVGMSPKQAIALADCLPDGPRLAHLNILENPMLSALAAAKDEGMQEEACALYASLMAAVRVSSTLICIDIDVPSAENSEVVKALAKQVVAYSLRNMEQFAIAEATGSMPPSMANATAKLTAPHGGEKKIKEITVPDVLMHLVGHVEGNSENHDADDPAPDEDYIVGGTGVVKALQYVLGEKAEDLRRTSVPSTPISGALTPREGRPGSSAGFPPTEEQRGKAKKMSKNLLDSARKIRFRLQPALMKEATAGDELAYRRLLFLDQTLQSMIERFEEEYPECRLEAPQSPIARDSTTSSISDRKTDLSINTQFTELTNATNISDDEDDASLSIHAGPSSIKRHGSEVSLASRALSLEEGRLHRLGQHLRREVLDSPTTLQETERERIQKLGEKLESISGPELKGIVENEGWGKVLKKVGGNYDDLRKLQESDPAGWEQFVESQMKARENRRQGSVMED